MNQACMLPTSAPEARAALDGVKTIAVVGLSPRAERPSHSVSQFLKSEGYIIIPIRPAVTEVLGEKAHASLAAYGQAVDMVLIFRRPEAVPDIVEQALRLPSRVIWMQQGICHEEAAQTARAAGLKVVQNLCIQTVLMNF